MGLAQEKAGAVPSFVRVSKGAADLVTHQKYSVPSQTC
jgi:hypothetical protein